MVLHGRAKVNTFYMWRSVMLFGERFRAYIFPTEGFSTSSFDSCVEKRLLMLSQKGLSLENSHTGSTSRRKVFKYCKSAPDGGIKRAELSEPKYYPIDTEYVLLRELLDSNEGLPVKM